VRDSVEKTLDRLGQRQKALATQNLDYLQNVIRTARELGIGSPSIDDARRGLGQLASLSANGAYVEYTATVRRSLELAEAVVEAGQKVLDERIQQLRGEIEQRKANLRKEIQRRGGRVVGVHHQSGLEKPAQPKRPPHNLPALVMVRTPY
jgi:hypothetical protein